MDEAAGRVDLREDQDFDAARALARVDQPLFEGENHLVYRSRGDAEAALDVGFGRRSQVDAGVGVDEGHILALLGREAGLRSARHLIHLSILLRLQPEAAMNVRYRVELTQYERDQLGALLSGGKQAARKLKRAQILLAADAGVAEEDIADTWGSAARRCTGPRSGSWKAIWSGR